MVSNIIIDPTIIIDILGCQLEYFSFVKALILDHNLKAVCIILVAPTIASAAHSDKALVAQLSYDLGDAVAILAISNVIVASLPCATC